MREHQLCQSHYALAVGVELVIMLRLLNHLLALIDELLMHLVQPLRATEQFVDLEEGQTFFKHLDLFVLATLVLESVTLVICFLNVIISDSITILLFLMNHERELAVHGVTQGDAQLPAPHPWSLINFFKEIIPFNSLIILLIGYRPI